MGGICIILAGVFIDKDASKIGCLVPRPINILVALNRNRSFLPIQSQFYGITDFELQKKKDLPLGFQYGPSFPVFASGSFGV